MAPMERGELADDERILNAGTAVDPAPGHHRFRQTSALRHALPRSIVSVPPIQPRTDTRQHELQDDWARESEVLRSRSACSTLTTIQTGYHHVHFSRRRPVGDSESDTIMNWSPVQSSTNSVSATV